jgi:two-component system KDP operon response regulator KdpE
MTTPPAKVLIIEDEKQIRRFVRVAVEEEGLPGDRGRNHGPGLLEAGARKPDLLILDLGLPDGNGIDLIRDLRGWSDVPVLILSAVRRRTTRSMRWMPAPTIT